jgi:hypothetical protein
VCIRPISRYRDFESNQALIRARRAPKTQAVFVTAPVDVVYDHEARRICQEP